MSRICIRPERHWSKMYVQANRLRSSWSVFHIELLISKVSLQQYRRNASRTLIRFARFILLACQVYPCSTILNLKFKYVKEWRIKLVIVTQFQLNDFNILHIYLCHLSFYRGKAIVMGKCTMLLACPKTVICIFVKTWYFSVMISTVYN